VIAAHRRLQAKPLQERAKGASMAWLHSAPRAGADNSAPETRALPEARAIKGDFLMKALFWAGLGLAALLSGSAAASAKTLVYCSEGSPENFTPAINTTGTSFDAARPIYNRLTEFQRGTTIVSPGLAESWEISDGGKTIVFHLRKGVKFHSVKDFKPTRDFDADDVLFSFNRQWKPDSPYYKVSGGKYDYFNDMDMPSLLDTIEKKDPYTIVMKLKTPNVAILANLAMDFASIGSAEYADFLLKKGTPEQFDQVPVGTGPFSFVAYQKDAVIRYKANKDYFGEKALVDDLVFAITPDATARYAKLKAGECHVNAYPRPADLPEIQQDATLKVYSKPGLNIAFWAFNVTKPPFDKKEVRQALSMAIDKSAIIKDVYLGAGEPAKTLIPSTMWSYNDKIEDYPYDPEKAKAMLQAAGVAAPLDIDLWYMPVARPYNPNGKRIGEMMQADLAKIGVNAKLVSYEWGEYRKRAQGGEDITAQLGWTGDNGDPDNFFFLDGCTDGKPAANNIPKWCNAEFNDLLAKARVLSDQGERAKLYERMQVIEHEEPEFLIAHSTVFEVTRADVVGYKQSPLGTHIFEGVDVK
jgi:dipeptide transport system substrate-binding protein